MIRPAAEPKYTHQQLLGALRDPIRPVRAGVAYRFGLLLVALVMLLLPLVYVVVVGLVGYAVYWHAVHDAGMLKGGGSARLRVLAYAAPLLIGSILLLFMIKPLFARRVRRTFPLSLARNEEPTLFAFVERLCEIVGAPKPRRIDVDTAVNASASFTDGITGLLRRDLVLTIGLPLVAGLSLRQLTGVLAHEFGHFAQGTGMRLTYLIRNINGWFARVVYERDSWDEWLYQASQDSGNGLVTVLAAMARFLVWITRRVLWVLMWFGHAVSSFMLRQMEFDADRYEARVAGSGTFVDTAEKLVALEAASHAAFTDLSVAWRERRLCDDLPTLISFREREMPSDVRQTITKHTRAMKTGWFDSHPCDADRIAGARKENTSGIFTFDAPAKALFQNFDELSRRATVAFYHQHLEGQVQPENLIATESLVADRGRKRETLRSLLRYFQALIHPVRPAFPERILRGVADQAGAAEMLLELRSQYLADIEPARHAAEEFLKADAKLTSVARLRAVRNAGVRRFNPSDFGLVRGDDAEIISARKEASDTRGAALETLDNILTIGMQRLELALSINAPERPHPTDSAGETDDFGEYDLSPEGPAGSQDRLGDALRCLEANAKVIEDARQQFCILGALLAECKFENNPQELIESTLNAARKLLATLGQLQRGLFSTIYPYEHVEKGVTLATFALPHLPRQEQVTDVMTAADQGLDALYNLYIRIMSDLAYRAEQIEQSLGLPPLPEPVEEKLEQTSQVG